MKAEKVESLREELINWARANEVVSVFEDVLGYVKTRNAQKPYPALGTAESEAVLRGKKQIAQGEFIWLEDLEAEMKAGIADGLERRAKKHGQPH